MVTPGLSENGNVALHVEHGAYAAVLHTNHVPMYIYMSTGVDALWSHVGLDSFVVLHVTDNTVLTPLSSTQTNVVLLFRRPPAICWIGQLQIGARQHRLALKARCLRLCPPHKPMLLFCCCCWFLFSVFLLCCPNGNFSHGKFGSLPPRKASCNRAALPNVN